MNSTIFLFFAVKLAFAAPAPLPDKNYTLHPDGTYSVCPGALAKLYAMRVDYAVVERVNLFWKQIYFVDSDSANRNPGRNVVKTDRGLRLRYEFEFLKNENMKFVVDKDGVMILDRMGVRHPNMVGGVDPRVRAAGEVQFKDGLIYRIGVNHTGHYRTLPETEPIVKAAFTKEFPEGMFHPDFQGYVER